MHFKTDPISKLGTTQAASEIKGARVSASVVFHNPPILANASVPSIFKSIHVLTSILYGV